MNSARAAKTWKTIRPPGVVVSSASCSEVNPMPRLRTPDTIANEILDRAAEPVQRRNDERVPLAQEVEDLPQFLALGVLARLLVGEDPDASRFGECVDLPVEQLPLGGHARVSHEAAGSYGRNETGVRRSAVSSSWGGCTRQIVQKRVLLKFLSTSTFCHRSMSMVQRRSGRAPPLTDLAHQSVDR